MLFHHEEAFRAPEIGPSTRLNLTWVHPAYRDHGSPRHGACYMLRKSKRPAHCHPPGAERLDDLSHVEIAQAFNRCETFYCYDLYTMYSRYAALSGCVPIIVPEKGVSREAWIPAEAERYGLAYGPDDVQWAIDTRPLLLERLRQRQAEEDALLAQFVERCCERFYS